MADWFYGENGQHTGPVREEEFNALIASGRIAPTALVWKEGMAEWMTLDQVRQTGAFLAASPYNSPYGSPYQTPGAPGAFPQPAYVYHNFGPRTSGLAIASLICGIVAFISCFFPLGIPAIICGHMAMSRISAEPFLITGRGMAVIGLVLGYIAVLAVAAFVVFMVIAAISTHRP